MLQRWKVAKPPHSLQYAARLLVNDKPQKEGFQDPRHSAVCCQQSALTGLWVGFPGKSYGPADWNLVTSSRH
jgi:hypothetical protein